MSPAPDGAELLPPSDGGMAPDVKIDVPRLVRLSAESKGSANQALAEGKLERAAELYLRGVQRLEDLDLEEHTEAKPLLVALLLNLSLCRLRMDEPVRARNAASRALLLEPRSEKGFYRRAEAAMRLSDHDAAEADLTSLLKDRPDNTAAVRLLRELRTRRRTAAAVSKERAERMLASGSLYAEREASSSTSTQAETQKEEASDGSSANASSRPPPSDWAKEAGRRLFGGSSKEEQLYDEEASEQARAPTRREAEPVDLPPDWEAVRDAGGAEIWRRKGGE